MKKSPWICAITVIAVLFSHTVFADQEDDLPWERFNLLVGAMITNQDSSFRLNFAGTNGGNVDGESDLGLEDRTDVVRIEGFVRLGNRHRFHLGYMDLSRDATTTLDNTITIQGKVFPVTGVVDTQFDLKLYKAAYSYSFIQNRLFELGLMVGVHVADFDLEVKSAPPGIFAGEKYTAPLPLIGLVGGVALTPKLFIKPSVQALYLESGGFTGTMVDSNITVEYNLLPFLGLGVGYNYLFVDVDAKPGSLADFDGKLEYSYDGAFLFGKLWF